MRICARYTKLNRCNTIQELLNSALLSLLVVGRWRAQLIPGTMDCLLTTCKRFDHVLQSPAITSFLSILFLDSRGQGSADGFGDQ